MVSSSGFPNFRLNRVIHVFRNSLENFIIKFCLQVIILKLYTVITLRIGTHV